MAKRIKNPGTIRFSATIEPPKAFGGGDCWVAFPYDLQKLYGLGNWVPIIATVDKMGFRSSLQKKGWFLGRPYLRIPKRVWRRLRKAAGDRVEVAVVIDSEPSEVTVPAALKVALLRTPAARSSFRKLSHLRRREYVYWIDEVGQEAMRKRRVARAIEMLAQGETLRYGRHV